MSTGALYEKIETYFIVSVITVLIWLYAEGEISETHTLRQVRVQFVAKSAMELAIEPPECKVDITFEASNTKLDAIKLITDKPVHIEVAPDSTNENPTQMIDLAARLSDTVFGKTGVIVTSATPSSVEVDVQPLKQVVMSIKPRIEGIDITEWNTEPSEVTVTLPEDLARRIPTEPSVIARLDPETLRNMPAGVSQSVKQVKLTLPPEWKSVWSKISPRTAAVSFTIVKRTQTVNLPTVPLYISAPSPLLSKYKIELPREHWVLSDVKLEGPSDVMELISGNEIRIVAEIRPTAAQLDGGVDILPVFIVTPERVTVKTPPQTVPVIVTENQ